MQDKYKVVTSAINYPDTLETVKVVDDKKLTSYKILDTYINLEWLLAHFDITIRYNRMSRRREIFIPEYNTDKDHEANSQITFIKRICALNRLPVKNVDEFLDIIAYHNSYHPIVDILNQHKWDGVDRLNVENSFYDTIVGEEQDFDRRLISTWMRAAIAAAHSVDGFENHGVLVLQGAQGIGKTRWCRKLDPIGCGAVKPDANVDPRNKDSIIGLARFWIAEIGELDGTFNKSHIAHLKGFITSNVDDVRVPWGKQESRLIRRTAYIATVNNEEFLVDTTGNRRWWSIEVNKINAEHNFDMVQVWAQVKHEWQQGGSTYLNYDDQKILAERNLKHEISDPLFELLHTHYDWTTSTRRKLTATDVLHEIGYDKPSQKESTRMGVALTKKTGLKSKKHNGAKVHLVPLKLSTGFV